MVVVEQVVPSQKFKVVVVEQVVTSPKFKVVVVEQVVTSQKFKVVLGGAGGHVTKIQKWFWVEQAFRPAVRG